MTQHALTDHELDSLEIEFLDVPVFPEYEIQEATYDQDTYEPEIIDINDLIYPFSVEIKVIDPMTDRISEIKRWLVSQGITDYNFDFRAPTVNYRYGPSHELKAMRIQLKDSDIATLVKLTWG